MNKKIQPITALRETEKLEKDLEENNGLLYITKNGYSSFVILSPDEFEKLSQKDTYPHSFSERKEIHQPFLEGKEQSDPLGFVNVRSATIPIEVGGVKHNKEEIIKKVHAANEDSISILVLNELCLTGYTCNDIFLFETLLNKSEAALIEIAKETKDDDVLFTVGLPLRKNNKLYNCVALLFRGKILGVVPKTFLPNYSEFYEARWFSPAPEENSYIEIQGKEYPFGKKMVFVNENYTKLRVGIEVCEDLWAPNTPSTDLALAGANVILNLSASNETVGKFTYRRDLVRMTSARLRAAYIYSDAGDGESTTDLVFASHNIIAEDGAILTETKPFEMEEATATIDIEKLEAGRLKTTTFHNSDRDMRYIPFSMPLKTPSKIYRHYSQNPFIPEDKKIDLERVQTILDIQAMGLVKRLHTVHQNKAVIGLSGGLDSTLALLVTVEAFKKAHFDLKSITAITLPAFGTSKRTHDNAKLLAEELGVSFEEINIKDTLVSHFRDINHDLDNHNVTYENAQARERTQVLMDIANDRNSLMVGTGDLSELCLGWCTYNGDHMSMYGVNASIPKTLVRYLCEGYALLHPETKKSLEDIVATPISPELLPTDKNGNIAQMTEDKVGPYELNDFFIYHFLRFGYRPKKLLKIALEAYQGKYDKEFIKKWLIAFFQRFFHNQFKRSCLPDGAKVGSVAISPRGDLRMPSDACVDDYLNEAKEL